MNEEKLDYLYAAISDTQSLINFIDTKTAGGITVIGLFLASIFSTLEELLKYAKWFSFLHWTFLCITLLLLILSIVVVARILKPTVNPENNIQKQNAPVLKFFLAKNTYDYGKIGRLIYPYYNSQKFKLSDSLETYSATLFNTSSEDIASSLSYELLKLNFIRNIKNDRFHFLFKLLVGTTLSFVCFTILHTKEMLALKALIACGCLK